MKSFSEFIVKRSGMPKRNPMEEALLYVFLAAITRVSGEKKD